MACPACSGQQGGTRSQGEAPGQFWVTQPLPCCLDPGGHQSPLCPNPGSTQDMLGRSSGLLCHSVLFPLGCQHFPPGQAPGEVRALVQWGWWPIRVWRLLIPPIPFVLVPFFSSPSHMHLGWGDHLWAPCWQRTKGGYLHQGIGSFTIPKVSDSILDWPEPPGILATGANSPMHLSGYYLHL
jgi:hypothetical protein